MDVVKQKSIKELVLEEKEFITKKIDKVIAQKKEIENYYDRIFDEISKLSNDFRIKKSKMVVWENVNYNHKNKKIKVDKVSKEYNECSISYVGQLPENKNCCFNISIEEHIICGRGKFINGYWNGKRNEGLKIALSINYDKPIYYKTGKSIVKKIKEKVDSIWEIHNEEIASIERINLTKKKLNEKFKDIKIKNIDSAMAYILLKNNLFVKLYHNANLQTGEVEFRIANVDFTMVIKNEEKLIQAINLFGTI